MDIDTLIEGLAAVGLEDEQADVYVRLLQSGPSKVSQLEPLLPYSRSKLYRMLDSLCDRGIVTKSLERPTIYEAVDPETLFTAQLRSLDRDRARVEETRQALVGPLSELAEGTETAETEHWTVLEGRGRIYETLEDLIDGAGSSIWLASNHEVTTSTLPPVEAARRLAERRVQDGIEIRALVHDPDRILGPVKIDVQAHPVEVRRLDVDEKIHFLIVDQRAVVCWVRLEPVTGSPREDVALWTDAAGLVAALRLLFEQLWEGATEIESASASASSGDGG